MWYFVHNCEIYEINRDIQREVERDQVAAMELAAVTGLWVR